MTSCVTAALTVRINCVAVQQMQCDLLGIVTRLEENRNKVE
jgi:hypothetical protein